MKNSNFYGNGRYPKFAFLVQLWPPVSPWRWPKSKKKLLFRGKSFSHRAIQISLNQDPISIAFCTILAIFGRKLAKIRSQRVRIKIWNSLFYQHGSWTSSSKKSLGPALFGFAAIGAKGRFCQTLTHFFKFGSFSQYHVQIFYKNKFDTPIQNFILNRLAPI